MVSEIRAEDDETLDQLMKQGFLPLNTPVDRIGVFLICQFSKPKLSHLLLTYCVMSSSCETELLLNFDFIMSQDVTLLFLLSINLLYCVL